MDVTPKGLHLKEVAKGYTIDDIRKSTEAPLIVKDVKLKVFNQLKQMKIPQKNVFASLFETNTFLFA